MTTPEAARRSPGGTHAGAERPATRASSICCSRLGGLVTLAGLGAAHLMEERGHVITGMNNHVVWGLPHVFAIFMIVAGSGVLNVASIGSVFGVGVYKQRAPLSALLSLALLAGGLMVLMLDLGRPERLIVAATHYNFSSVFAWNVFLYSGMFAIVAIYLWTMFERRFNGYTQAVGIAALVWRFALTTGTGSIFGFLVARQAYQSALLAPLFIVMSFGWGLAVFLLVQSALLAWHGQTLDAAVRRRLMRLLGVFAAAALYLVVVFHMTNLYFARQDGFEAFILLGRGGGGVFAALFWAGYVVLGSVLPLLLVFHPRLARRTQQPRRLAAGAARRLRLAVSSSSSAARPSRSTSSRASKCAAASATAPSRLCAALAGAVARPGRHRRGLSRHHRRCALVRLPPPRRAHARRRRRRLTTMHCPRLLISAAHKSSGKTTLSIGLARALADQGRVVQTFKKGPDYIDPMWLARASGRPCFNLDAHLMDDAALVRCFADGLRGAELALVEGNKGLYDGLALDGSNSNAALARRLRLPVLLVIDARGMTRGIAPLILGYQAFEPRHPHRRRDPEPPRRCPPRGQAACGDRALHRRARARRRGRGRTAGRDGAAPGPDALRRTRRRTSVACRPSAA